MMMRMTMIAMSTLMVLAANASAQHNDQHNHSGHSGHGISPGSSIKPSVLNTNTAKAGPHGGSLKLLEAMQIETVVAPGGLRLYAFDLQGKPLDLRGARGLVKLKVEGGTKTYRFDLFPEIAKDGSAASLAVAVDLSRMGGRKAELTSQLVGVPGARSRPAKFVVKLTMPMTEAQQLAAAIKQQGVCPVSGQPLESMGKPIAVAVGSQTVYVCCAGCIDAVKSNPSKYLTKKPQLVVTKATDADDAQIARQKLCPVMDEPLGGMGPPLKVTGLGRDVFLCCKGCLKFLEKEPQKYLAKLPPLPGPRASKATSADAQ